MKTAILHYSAYPVIGGVEAVIDAHARQFAAAGLPVTVIAGSGQAAAMPAGVDFVRVEEMASDHAGIETATACLNDGRVPDDFEFLTGRLAEKLRPVLGGFDNVIIHNIMTKHFNLPLTAALVRLMDEGCIQHTIAWCHDLTWSSPNSRVKVHPGYPWDLLKTYRRDVTYIAISGQRRKEIVETFACPADEVKVIPNGVDPDVLLGLSPQGEALAGRLELWKAGLILLMPVRVTHAKNIELALEVTAELKRLGKQPKLVITGPPDPHDPGGMAYFESLRRLRKGLDIIDEARFVYESGPEGEGKGFTIPQKLVAQLYRMADAVFMPSHREGFGMPVLEAALVGLPVISTCVPAIQDLAMERVLLFSAADSPEILAGRIAAWMDGHAEHAAKVLMRRCYTWKAIFENDLLPLLRGR